MAFETVTSAVHNRKVGLEVKQLGSWSFEKTYQFKFTSYETSAVSLNEYRVLALMNFASKSTETYFTNQGGVGTSFGATSGFLVTQDPTITKSYSSEEFPPRIRPQDKRYNFEIAMPFSGTATATASGSGFENHPLKIGFWALEEPTLIDALGENVIRGEEAVAKSYSYTSAAAYESNPTFVLEYNVSGDTWVKVQEYIGSTDSENDPNTGKYPYDVNFESNFATTDLSAARELGVNTRIDHILIPIDHDTQINESSPNTNYGSLTSMSLRTATNNSGGGNARRAMFMASGSGGITSADTVSAAELWGEH